MKNTTVLIILSLSLFSCNTRTKNSVDTASTNNKQYKIQYAKGFSVNKYDNYTELTVHNPWDSDKVLQNYILIDRNQEIPKNLPNGTIVRIPIKTAIAYSTIHCSSLHELKNTELIVGVCEPEYISIEEIQERLESGAITNLGMANSPDIERTLLLNPDVIFASPIVGENYGSVVKTHIPIIETPDYTEPSPLGRAEWIRFYSLFTNQEALADSLFNETARKYNEIVELSSKNSHKPRVFNDLKYRTSWNMAGGKSYMANMLKDAGGDYVWANDETTNFLQLSFETVLDKAGDADIWLIRHYSEATLTYTNLAKEYKPYEYFAAYKNKNIWESNTRISRFYEDLPIHPEKILKDYAYIFNSDLFPDYEPQYFLKMKE